MEDQKRPILLRNGNPQGNPANAPRCGARTRRGTSCQAPAMANGRCRMHGGKSTGPRTAAGLARCRQARYKHGRYSAETMARQQEVKRLMAVFEKTQKLIYELFGPEAPDPYDAQG